MAGSFYGIKAGKAFVIIEAVDKTAQILDRIRNRVARFGSDISQLGQTLAFRAAGALTPIAISLNTFAKFDDSMRMTEARAKGTAGEMENLREQAKELGRTTAFTASHIGMLMARLAQAKKTRAEIAEMTEPIMLLARAGGAPGGDLGQDIINATDAVTQVLSTYKMETKDTAKITDLLTAAVNNSRLSLEEIGTALQYAAPDAKAFNVPLEDLLVGLAVMRDLGYDASIAGTAFRNMLRYVSQEEERVKFNEMLKEMTGKTIKFTDETDNLINPLEMLVATLKAMEGVGTAKQMDILADLFEMRAAGPAVAVGSAAEKIAQLRTIMSDVIGLSRRTHDAMETGMGGTFRVLESAVEGVSIAIGEALNKAIVTQTGSTANAIKAISDWINMNRKWVVLIVATTVGVGALGLSLIILGQTLRMLSGLFLLVIVPLKLLGLLLSPGGLLIIGALALISVIPGIGEVFRSMTSDVASSLVTLTESWRTTLGGIATYLEHGQIQEAFQLLSMQVQITWKRMLDSLMTAWEVFKSGFKAADPLTDKLISNLEYAIEHLEKQKPSLSFSQEAIDRELAEKRERLLHLKATREGILAEIGAPHAARQREIADLEKQLKLLQDSAEIYRQLMTEAPSTFSSTVIPEFSEQIKKLEENIKNLITPDEAAAHTTGKREAIKGAELGTIEFAQRFQENRFNAMTAALDKLVGIASSSDTHLAAIEDGVGELTVATSGGASVVGV